VSSNSDNVILFPKTIEYYQSELTRLLEGERYAEAAGMLRFLLQCQSDDPEYKEEWQSLLGWLVESFPESVREQGSKGSGVTGPSPDDETEDEVDEAGMLQRHVRAKAANDSKFVDKLLDMLEPHATAEKQMMALEQLAHLDRRIIGDRLRSWLSESRLHPLVQFRGLQVLRTIGETGTIEIRKLGQTMTLTISDTPVRYEEYPEHLRGIGERVKSVMESKQPGLTELIEATWKDFLAFVYGTAVYDELLALDETGKAVWAAALHHTVDEMIFERADEQKLGEIYGLPESVSKSLNKAQQVIKLFATVSSPAES